MRGFGGTLRKLGHSRLGAVRNSREAVLSMIVSVTPSLGEEIRARIKVQLVTKKQS